MNSEKEFLQTIALHLDLFNTISGGVSETHATIRKGMTEAKIEVWAAGIAPEAFKIGLHNNKLTVSYAVTSQHNHNVKAPMFSRTFVLSSAINLPQIEVSYLEGKMHLKLPYYDSVDSNKEVNIEQL